MVISAPILRESRNLNNRDEGQQIIDGACVDADGWQLYYSSAGDAISLHHSEPARRMQRVACGALLPDDLERIAGAHEGSSRQVPAMVHRAGLFFGGCATSTFCSADLQLDGSALPRGTE